ncbi:MAG: hypothetical protein CMN27_01140 [Salinisphaera sp.]|nr:hypothetical protein [Salinisphaera sp.]
MLESDRSVSSAALLERAGAGLSCPGFFWLFLEADSSANERERSKLPNAKEDKRIALNDFVNDHV